MKKIKIIYQYIFYKIYKFYKRAPAAWWSDWKASLTLDVLLFFIILSLYIYYQVFINPYAKLTSSNIYCVVIVIVISVFNYFIFGHNDQWMLIEKRFDKLPAKKNKIGSWLVLGFVTLVMSNLLFAFYLMSQIDWSLYK